MSSSDPRGLFAEGVAPELGEAPRAGPTVSAGAARGATTLVPRSVPIELRNEAGEMFEIMRRILAALSFPDG